MSNKLDILTIQYRKFSESQALTAGQLNEVIDFFEDQDRLSRTRLTGVGLAHGFKTTIKNNVLNITQGIGVTTDGDLITLRDKREESQGGVAVISDLGEKVVAIDITNKNYTHYRAYNYPEFDGVVYGYDNISDSLNLWELRNESEISDDIGFEPLEEDFFSGKYVVLYLESFSKDEPPCEGIDCDNQGAEQVFNLRILVTDIEGAESIANSDTIYSATENLESLHKTFPEVEAKRAILSEEITEVEALKLEFKAAIDNTDTNSLIVGIEKVAETFNLSLVTDIGSKINEILKESTFLSDDAFQYRYDVLKDLIATYNEIRSFILNTKRHCSPDINAFPKHILLGLAGAPLDIVDDADYRHDFYKSPILGDNGESYKRLAFLIERFEELLNDFDNSQTISQDIKITPSTTSAFLGNRAIPFYYDVSPELVAKWNFEKSIRGKEAYNLSYRTANLAEEDDFIVNPLNYKFTGFDFFRIEGHIGVDYKVAYEAINSKRIAQNLPFKIKVLSLDELTDTSNFKMASSSTSLAELETALASGNQKEALGIIAAMKNTAKTGEEEEETIETELLATYLDRNSGLEHRGGVEFGGTFILVYDNDPSAMTPVIADFCVPYNCCEKEELVLLNLPTDAVCEYEELIPIGVIPEDGVVTAYVGEKELEGAIIEEEGKCFFDPSAAQDYLKREITFQVNGEAVENQIVVYPAPNVEITHTIEYTDGKDEATVFYAGLEEGYKYEFDFLGNGIWTAIDEEDKVGEIEYPIVKEILSKTYVLTTISELNTGIRIVSEHSCVQEIIINQKFNRRPVIEDNTVLLDISVIPVEVPYTEIVHDFNDVDNDGIKNITFLSKQEDVNFEISEAGTSFTNVSLNNAYIPSPEPEFQVAYNSELENPLYLPKNTYEGNNLSTEIIEIDKTAYEDLISEDYSILSIDNEDEKERSAIFQKITNSIEEIPNDTIIYVHVDTTSLLGSDQEKIVEEANTWYSDFIKQNSNFNGDLIVNPLNSPAGTAVTLLEDNIATIKDSNLFSEEAIQGATYIYVELWLETPIHGILRKAHKDFIENGEDGIYFGTITDNHFKFNSEELFFEYASEKSIIVLSFIDESNLDATYTYHPSNINNNFLNPIQPTDGYKRNYNDFLALHNVLKFFKGVLSPITVISSSNKNAFQLQALAAIEARVLTEDEVDRNFATKEEIIQLDNGTLTNDKIAKVEQYGAENMQSYFYNNLTSVNPYETAELTELKKLGWEGRFDKFAPVADVLSSNEFSEELDEILTDTSTIQVTKPSEIKLPIKNLGTLVETNITLKVTDDNTLISRESDIATVNVNFSIPAEQQVPVLNGRLYIYEADFGAVEIPHSIPVSRFVIPDIDIDRIKIEELTLVDSNISFNINTLFIEGNVPIVIKKSAIESGELNFIVNDIDKIPSGTTIIELNYRVAKRGQINYSEAFNTFRVILNINGNPTIQYNTVEKDISLGLSELSYTEVVHDFNDADNDKVGSITFLSKHEKLNLNISEAEGSFTSILNTDTKDAETYVALPEPEFQVAYDSELENPLYLPKNVYDGNNVSTEIIEIDKSDYEDLISENYTILSIDNEAEDENLRAAIFQKINNSIEELPNDTIIYIHIDTSSLEKEDISAIEGIVSQWWDDFVDKNEDFEGSFLVNTLFNNEITRSNYEIEKGLPAQHSTITAPLVRSTTLTHQVLSGERVYLPNSDWTTFEGRTYDASGAENWLQAPIDGFLRQAFKEGRKTDFTEEEFLDYIEERSMITLVFGHEVDDDYHGGKDSPIVKETTVNYSNKGAEGAVITEPTSRYVTDYKVFVDKIRPKLKFFKGVLYPIINFGFYPILNANWLLHAMSAIEGTDLTPEQIKELMIDPNSTKESLVEQYGSNMQSYFYDNLSDNPYKAYPDLKSKGWEGRYTKYSPVLDVLASEEFGEELNEILTDTTTVQITEPITEELPIKNLGAVIETNFTLNITEDNELISRESNTAKVNVNFTIPVEDIAILSGRTDVYEATFEAIDTVYPIPISSFEINDETIDRIKIEELTLVDSSINFKINALSIDNNAPIIIEKSAIESGELNFIVNDIDKTLSGTTIIEFTYKVAKQGQVNYSKELNTLTVILNINEDLEILGASKVCYNSDLIQLNVTPYDAIVEAYVGKIKIDAIDKDNFYPSRINNLYYGESIEFNVNGKRVDAIIVVNGIRSEITLETPTVVLLKEGENLAEFTFQVLLVDINDVFNWEYGDGTKDKISKITDGPHTRTYSLEPEEQSAIFKPMVTIENTNIGCGDKIITFEIEVKRASII